MVKISDTPEGIGSHELSILIPEEILQSFEIRKVIENESGTMATKAFGAFLERNSLIAIPSRLAQSQ